MNLCILMTLYLITQILVGVVLIVLLNNILVASILSTIVGTLLTMYAYICHFPMKTKNKQTISKFVENLQIKEFRISHLFSAIFVVILCLAIQVVVSFLFNPAITQQGYTTQVIANSTNIFTRFLFPIIIAPVIEELFFRGTLHSAMDKSKTSILLIALAFAIVHLNFNNLLTLRNLTIFINTFIASICMSYLYKKYKSILLPIITHALFNFIVLVIMNA